MSEKEHPPIANRVVCVDFDGTLIPWGPLMEARAVEDLNIKAMQRLRAEGYRIVIFTSRASATWWKAEDPERWRLFGARQMDYVADILERHEVPYDDITAEKVPAEAYFDDKAFTVNQYRPLYDAISDFLGDDPEGL